MVSSLFPQGEVRPGGVVKRFLKHHSLSKTKISDQPVSDLRRRETRRRFHFYPPHAQRFVTAASISHAGEIGIARESSGNFHLHAL
jgi:hypothetical protein